MNNTELNRRDFIRNLALTGSAIALAASPWIKVFGENNPIGKGANDSVNLGFIGTGSRGQELLKNLLTFAKGSNVNINALCDNFELHLKAAEETCRSNGFSPKTYSKFETMVEKEKLDAVIIATPLHEHAHITIDCLQYGLHVFCEKAMARTLEDTKRMYDTHLQTGNILQIGHQRLFNPVYIGGMQRIHDGKLGTIGQIRAYWHRNNNWRRPLPNNDKSLERKINWRLYKDYSAGLLTELLSHQIHIANWALQKTPVSVMGTGSIRFWKDGREVPDNVALIYTYGDGTNFVYDSMISNRKYGLEEQILGHKGTIEFEVNKQYAEEPTPAPGIQQLINNIEHGIFDALPIGQSSWVPETATNFKGQTIIEDNKFSDTALELEAFVSFIRKGKAPEKISREGYTSSIWTLMGEKAIASGLTENLPKEYII